MFSLVYLTKTFSHTLPALNGCRIGKNLKSVSYEIRKAVLPVLGSHGEGRRAGWGYDMLVKVPLNLRHSIKSCSTSLKLIQLCRVGTKEQLLKTNKWKQIFLLVASETWFTCLRIHDFDGSVCFCDWTGDRKNSILLFFYSFWLYF
jgi:hypothetical protein